MGVSSHIVLSKRPLSTAQSCNDDVLDLIFLHISRRDLPALALTCKRWSPAAHRALYTSVVFGMSFKGTTMMEKLAPTLASSDYIRHLVRHVKLTWPEGLGLDACPSPELLFDWLPLLPRDTVMSLDIYTYPRNRVRVDAARFMDILLRCPMLHSIRRLKMTNGEAFFEGVNRMSQLLMLTPSVSHLCVAFPITIEIGEIHPRYYAPFTAPIPCRARYLAVWMSRYTPLFGELLKVMHRGSLETLLCHASDSHRFPDEFARAREITFSSPIQTLFFDSNDVEGDFPLLSLLPGSWPKLRELVLSGWRLQWDALASQLPPSLEALVLNYTFHDEFPIEQLTHFVTHAPTSHPALSRLVICNVGRRRRHPFPKLETICAGCGILLQLYQPRISWPARENTDSWTLETMLVSRRLLSINESAKVVVKKGMRPALD